MGNKETVLKDDQLQHPRLGPLRIYPSKHSDAILMQKLIFISNRKLYQEWLKHISKESQVCLFPQQTRIEQGGLCSFSVKSFCSYQYFPFVLQTQIANRVKVGSTFKQQEIWFIAFLMLQSTVDYQIFSQKVNDIRPQNILLNSVGLIKIINCFSWPQQESALVNTFLKKQISYLSPQELMAINNKTFSPNLNYALADSFAIGMTLLQLVSGKSSKELYLINDTFQINQVQLQQRLKKAKSQFSTDLIRLMQVLLQKDPLKRLLPGQVWFCLQAYEQKINNFQPFRVQQDQLRRKSQSYRKLLQGIVKEEICPNRQHLQSYLKRLLPPLFYHQTKPSGTPLHRLSSNPYVQTISLRPIQSIGARGQIR